MDEWRRIDIIEKVDFIWELSENKKVKRKNREENIGNEKSEKSIERRGKGIVI